MDRVGKFETFRGDDREFRWHLRGANGEIVCQSEGYRSEDGAERGIESVRRTVTETLSDEELLNELRRRLARKPAPKQVDL